MNVLFICSKNQWRSPTAEKVFARDPMLAVRSRGVSKSARRVVTAGDIIWADIVFVMESEHKRRLRADYPRETRRTEVEVLDIPDDYEYMDPELVGILKAAVGSIIQSRLNE